jgi:hypothetical protein
MLFYAYRIGEGVEWADRIIAGVSNLNDAMISRINHAIADDNVSDPNHVAMELNEIYLFLSQKFPA